MVRRIGLPLLLLGWAGWLLPALPAAAQLADFEPPPRAAAPQSPVLTPIEEGRLVARIGSEVVLAGDVLPMVNEMIERNKDKIPPSQYDTIRRELMKRQVAQLIDTKLLLADARRTIPKENFPTIWSKLDEQFEKSELEKFYKSTKTNNPRDLDQAFRQFGTSLEQQKKVFRERTLAMQWMREKVDFEPAVTHEEILAYYHDNVEKYAYEAAVQWEEIAVEFDRFPTHREAYRTLAELGNRVLKGEKFADVAKAHSHGLTAAEGGRYDWTTQGSLRSQALDRAIFTLPIGELSQIIETQAGFHIVRVIERREAGHRPFIEAQVEIREQLRREKIQQQMKDVLARLREKTRVWTVFDAEDQTAANTGASRADR